jgi:ribosomal protein S18 acetylase RimI-like enzyme
LGHDLSAEAVAARLAELRALCELTDYLHRGAVVASSRVIRSVEPPDLEAVRVVLVDAWHDTYDATLGVERVTEITDSWHAIEALATEIGRPEHRFMLVESGGEIVATGSADRAGDVVTLQRLYVRPVHQGAGHGAVLLDALVGHWPHARVELKVATHNARAIAFYERHGFVLAGRPDDEHFAMRREA